VTRSKPVQVMIVEDDPALQRQIRWSLDRFECTTAEDAATALQAFRRAPAAVVTMDLGLPPDADGVSQGMQLLEALLAAKPLVKVIVLTGQSDRANALKAVQLGAYDFMVKPLDADALGLTVERALKMHGLQSELLQIKSLGANDALEGLITQDAPMLELCRMIEKVGRSDATVALLGESGTGKEVLAAAVHKASKRTGRFVAINCSAIPDNLLESELFGYEKGAFTGAFKTTVGRVETAHEGTLFLDEIGDLPGPLQAKLLRFLQERKIERLGGRQEIAVDVRVVCATHQNLKALIAAGSFREDLFYRLSEVVLSIPPLRHRGGDAVLLGQSFLNQHAQSMGKSLRLTDAAQQAMRLYAWPGNVRELQNRVKRAAIMVEGLAVGCEDLGLPAATQGDAMPHEALDLHQAREQAERTTVTAALARTEGNVAKAAGLLGISRPTLYDLMARLKLIDERRSS
jgi:two-component system, NtrC family, response regulator